jgi:N-acetylneuraminate synthase
VPDIFEINGVKVGKDQRPYIIAELSANHGGSIEVAKTAILAAKQSGASAVKLQTYTPDTITINSDKPDFKITNGPWAGNTLYDLYSQAYTPFDWHEELFRYAASVGLTIFSSPFDFSAIELLQNLKAPAYKIASFELIDLPLIEAIARCGKPVLASTGMASLNEIGEALETIKKAGMKDILLFHCISSYPAPTENSNLNNLRILSKEFDVEIGLSDHTLSNMAAILAVGLGAAAIEKHFKVKQTGEGPDSKFSLLPHQFASLVEDCYLAWQALGDVDFTRAPKEEENRTFRRSLYFIRDVAKGSTISARDVKSIRPGYGLHPKLINQIIGKKTAIDVQRGDPVKKSAIVDFS